uniref:Uncharacterized protein n=1 Tax=Picea glauca TaxID=3330 RepID=A0A101LX85_PICGL|nr:hypothetical protein ABT39_MTgene6283 [Picea glauca]QHR87987.1 hypothetical protein Q903MT_gene1999 [Picea sitchensis]
MSLMDVLRVCPDQRAHIIETLSKFLPKLGKAHAPSLSFDLSSIPFTEEWKAKVVNMFSIEIRYNDFMIKRVITFTMSLLM